MMPQMDGFELCKTIKSDLSYSHIPVVLLTAKTNIQSKIEGLELGLMLILKSLSLWNICSQIFPA